MAMESYEVTLEELIGYTGGCVLAVALVPQVVKSVREWSTADISYGWQFIYISGLWLNLLYFVLVGAVAAWVTLCVEIAFAHGLLFLKDVYRGFHYMVDATFDKELPAQFGNDLMDAMLEAAMKHNVRVVAHMVEIFDGSESPPGFASAALIDESHMSAHCYTDQGLLAFDCFTCGANPEKTRLLTNDVVDYLKKHLGMEARFDVGRMPRFPVRQGQRTQGEEASV